MGNEQSGGQGSPQQRRQVPPKSPEKDPYTLSSVSKDHQQKQSPSNVSSENADNDGIIKVVTMERGPEGNDSLSPSHDDEVLETLRNLPRVTPLIRSSVESNFTWKDFVIPRVIPTAILRNANQISAASNVPNLDYIDSKPLFDICAEFQTFAMREAHAISLRQEEMIGQMRTVHFQSQNVAQQMAKKSDGLKKMATALRDVERINRNVEASRQSVANILKQLQELEELLPHHVKAQIKTPLFASTNVEIAPPTTMRIKT